MRLDHLLSMENRDANTTHHQFGILREILLFNFRRPRQEAVGFDNAEGPPVPIPNTEVKLCGADNTSLETAREDRKKPTPEAGR